MSDRLNRLLAEAGGNAPKTDDEIKAMASEALKSIGIKRFGEPQVTRSYNYGAEVQFGVGSIDGKRAWLEVTLSYDRGDHRIALRRQGYSKSVDLVSGKKEIHDLAKLMKSLV
jgi:hypothetical protein